MKPPLQEGSPEFQILVVEWILVLRFLINWYKWSLNVVQKSTPQSNSSILKTLPTEGGSFDWHIRCQKEQQRTVRNSRQIPCKYLVNNLGWQQSRMATSEPEERLGIYTYIHIYIYIHIHTHWFIYTHMCALTGVNIHIIHKGERALSLSPHT